MNLHWEIAWGIVLGYVGIQVANLILKGVAVAIAALIIMGGKI